MRDAPQGRGRLAFAARMQAVLVVAMLASFAMMTQQLDVFIETETLEIDVGLVLYQCGLGLLIVSSILQIAFGNIPPGAGFGRSMRLLGITLAIVAAIFGLGIVLAPLLTQLGR